MIATTDASPDRTEPEPTARSSASSSTAKWALWLVFGYVAVHHALFCWFDQRLMLDHDEFHVGSFLQLHEIAETGPSGWVDVVASMWRRPPSPYPPLMQVLLALGTSAFGLTPTVYRMMALPWLLLLMWSAQRLSASRAGPWAGVAAMLVVASLPYTCIMTRKYFLHIYAGTAVLFANALYWSGWEKHWQFTRGITTRYAVGVATALAAALMIHPIGLVLAAPLIPLLLWHTAAHPVGGRRNMRGVAAVLAVLAIGAWSWMIPAFFRYLREHIRGFVHLSSTAGAAAFNDDLTFAETIQPFFPGIYLIVPGVAALILNSLTGAARFNTQRTYWVVVVPVFSALAVYFVYGGMEIADFVTVALMALIFSVEEIAMALKTLFRHQPVLTRPVCAALFALLFWFGHQELQKDFSEEPKADWNQPEWKRPERYDLRKVWPIPDPGYAQASSEKKAQRGMCRVRLSLTDCVSYGSGMNCNHFVPTYDSAPRIMLWAGCAIDPESSVSWEWSTWRYRGSQKGFDTAYREAIRALIANSGNARTTFAWGGGMTLGSQEQGLIALRVSQNDEPNGTP